MVFVREGVEFIFMGSFILLFFSLNGFYSIRRADVGWGGLFVVIIGVIMETDFSYNFWGDGEDSFVYFDIVRNFFLK